MAEQRNGGQERGRIHRSTPGGFPLVFREEPSLGERVVARIREFFGGDEGDGSGAGAALEPLPVDDPARERVPPPSPPDPAEPDASPAPRDASAGTGPPPGTGRAPDTEVRSRRARPDATRPVDGDPERPERATLQLLPGRLEPMNPRVVRQEVRFLRTPRPERGVTLGWADGPPPYHVTLNHPSIQPRHARMHFRDGSWWIENLSAEDPVVVNDRRLPPDADPRRLETGDRVRLGRAEFVFRLP